MTTDYCPRCDAGGGFELVTYYDASGREIRPSDDELSELDPGHGR